MNIKYICTNCNSEFNEETKTSRCSFCNEPLEISACIKNKNSKICFDKDWIFSKYKDFYPYLTIDKYSSLGEGNTPLIQIEYKNGDLNNRKLFIKNEGLNPTWSFKDRGTFTGILRAKQLGYQKVGTVSTGNMAASVAAYAARSGLQAYILVKDEIAEEKIPQIGIYGAKIIKVKGEYRNLYRESIRIGYENDIYFINSDAPYRIEGYKTIAFEIYEQLERTVPDFVIVPTSAGGNFRGIEKGFRELNKCGLTSKIPRFIAVQAKGCNPIERAFINKTDIRSLEEFGTIAHAIENPNPPSGNQVLRIIRSNNGFAISVTDKEILEAQKILAEKGIFVQTASATSYASLDELYKKSIIKNDDLVVCIATAAGLKSTENLGRHETNISSCDLDKLQKFL